MQEQAQKQKYMVSEHGRIVGHMVLSNSEAEQMSKNGLNLSKEMKIQYKKEEIFQSPHANSAMASGNIGLAYELEDDWTEDGQISNREAWKRENRRYSREARGETYGLGNYAGDVVG